MNSTYFYKILYGKLVFPVNDDFIIPKHPFIRMGMDTVRAWALLLQRSIIKTVKIIFESIDIISCPICNFI